MADVVFQIKAHGGAPVKGAAVLVAYPDGRYLTGQTHADGKFQVDLYRTDQAMKVLVAAEGHLPYCQTLSKISEIVSIGLEPSKDDRKAVLFIKNTGYIPGITGRLNPDKDGYVYADNIAINGRLAIPAVHFKLGEALHLIDVYGVETTIWFLAVEGQYSLIEYTEPKAHAGE